MANKIEKQKGLLLGLSISGEIIGLALLVTSIILIVLGAKNVSSEHLKGGLELGFGILFVLVAGFFIVFATYTLFIGGALKATKGSIKEDNIPLNGTVNMIKCKNCGAEVMAGDDFCGVCGASLNDKKECPKCGATNMSENKKCSSCGADLE